MECFDWFWILGISIRVGGSCLCHVEFRVFHYMDHSLIDSFYNDFKKNASYIYVISQKAYSCNNWGYFDCLWNSYRTNICQCETYHMHLHNTNSTNLIKYPIKFRNHLNPWYPCQWSCYGSMSSSHTGFPSWLWYHL